MQFKIASQKFETPWGSMTKKAALGLAKSLAQEHGDAFTVFRKDGSLSIVVATVTPHDTVTV